MWCKCPAQPCPCPPGCCLPGSGEPLQCLWPSHTAQRWDGGLVFLPGVGGGRCQLLLELLRRHGVFWSLRGCAQPGLPSRKVSGFLDQSFFSPTTSMVTGLFLCFIPALNKAIIFSPKAGEYKQGPSPTPVSCGTPPFPAYSSHPISFPARESFKPV